MLDAPKTSIFTHDATVDVVARKYATSQDLTTTNNTPDVVATQLAIQLTEAFNTAIEAKGFRAITGIEIETDLTKHGSKVTEPDEVVGSICDILNDLPNGKALRAERQKGVVPRTGQYPLRQAYYEQGMGPELTTPPAYLTQTGHYATAIKQALLQANGEAIPTDSREVLGADYVARAQDALQGYDVRFDKVLGDKKTGEHISFSLHRPPQDASPDDDLHLADNNLIKAFGITTSEPTNWGKLLKDIFIRHSADDYALLYAGMPSMRRLQSHDTRFWTDMREYVRFGASDVQQMQGDRLNQKAAARIEYRLPSASSNSHLVSLQVAAYLYLACKTVHDMHMADERVSLNNLSINNFTKAITQINALHTAPCAIKGSEPDFAEHLCKRLDKGLLEQCVKALVSEIRSTDAAQAEALESTYIEFKDALKARTRALDGVELGEHRANTLQ